MDNAIKMDEVTELDLCSRVQLSLKDWLSTTFLETSTQQKLFHCGAAAYRTLASDYIQQLRDRCLLLGLAVEELPDGTRFSFLWYPIRSGLRISYHNISLYVLFNKVARNEYVRMVGASRSKRLDPFYLRLQYDRAEQKPGYGLSSKNIPCIEPLLTLLFEEREALMHLSESLDSLVVECAREEKIRTLFLGSIERVVESLLAPSEHPYHLQISAGQALLSFRLRRKKMLTLVLSPTSYMTQLQQLPGFLSRCNAQKSLSAMQSLVAQEYPEASLKTYGNKQVWTSTN